MASPSKPGATALITGANGFTGRYLRSELEQRGMLVSGTAAKGNHHHHASDLPLDLTDIEQCRTAIAEVRPDYLAHLGAITYVQHADVEAFYRVNVLGTLNLLQACADVGHTPRKVLIASSANIYGNTCEGVISEGQPAQPVNHYATSKLAMEFMVRTWFDRLPIVVTRPFNYTGVGQSEQFLAPKIVGHFRRREPFIELGNLDVSRDFTDVRTVVSAYAALLQSDIAAETVNICSGMPYSLRDIVSACSQIAGYDIEVRINPAFVRTNEVRTLIGSPEKLDSLVPGLVRVPFGETLRWMLQYSGG